jgi:plasmid stability protein
MPARRRHLDLGILDKDEIIDYIAVTMASITIRQLPAGTKEHLRVQAARAGLSLEAYVRQILQRTALGEDAGGPDLVSLAQQCFGPENGVELELPPRGSNRPPVQLD